MSQYKTCAKCDATLEIFQFYKQASRKDGLSYACKECLKKKSKLWRAENKERHRAYSAQWLKLNPEKARQTSKNWNEKNLEKVRASKEKWAKNNPEASRLKTLRRRAALRDAKQVTQKDIAKMMQKGCIYCQARAEHIDHVIPISKGGIHSLGNLAPSCAKCNLSKGGKLVSEWRYKNQRS